MSTPDLMAALETIFQRSITSVSRTRSPYSSSYPIERLNITFSNGEKVAAIFKNLDSDAMLEDARRAKPKFLYAPQREIQVYRGLLSMLDLGTPAFFGAAVNPALQRHWLFLEEVSGRQLDECGEFEIWLQVARWLARLHGSCEPEKAVALAPAVLECDAAYYWGWLERARAAAGPILDRIANEYDNVVNTLLTLPRALLHGEFYPSNILIQEQNGGIRVCPVDWEMAAIGPGLVDLAALASGKWGRNERVQMLEAYRDALPQHLRPENLLAAFDRCQLHVALQWLGWSKEWSPPEERAHDWLGEALRISAEESFSQP